jgi:hypothetical protein
VCLNTVTNFLFTQEKIVLQSSSVADPKLFILTQLCLKVFLDPDLAPSYF